MAILMGGECFMDGNKKSGGGFTTFLIILGILSLLGSCGNSGSSNKHSGDYSRKELEQNLEWFQQQDNPLVDD